MTMPDTDTVAGVPVHYNDEKHAEREEGPLANLPRGQARQRALEGLGGTPGATSALYAVASARYLAEKTGVLGDVLREPYTLRTTRDVEATVAALGQHIEALAGVAEGLGLWLDAAHQRGELEKEPAAVRAELGKTAELLRAAGLPLRELAAPTDLSLNPPIDLEWAGAVNTKMPSELGEWELSKLPSTG
jgi:hypothetical protein